MIAFDIEQLTPKFLLRDKNGYAMGKAIEAGMRYFLERVEAGLACVKDVETMPEWRLDEMAWELGCLYDHSADVESKRRWIREAMPYFAAYGTPKAIYNFLDGIFDDVMLEEFYQYGGEAFHFRVIASGDWTPEKEKWARNAIAQAKNVRSVLDGFYPGRRTTIGVHGEGYVAGRFPYEMTGIAEIDESEPDSIGSLVVVDKDGNGTLIGAQLCVDASGRATLTGATLTMNTSGDAFVG